MYTYPERVSVPEPAALLTVKVTVLYPGVAKTTLGFIEVEVEGVPPSNVHDQSSIAAFQDASLN